VFALFKRSFSFVLRRTFDYGLGRPGGRPQTSRYVYRLDR
jgi:hypothetical protein